MKKNIILTLILCSLISIAFLTEEVVKKDNYEKIKISKKLIKDISRVTTFSTSSLTLSLDTSSLKWFNHKINWPLDQKVMSEILEIFSKINVSASINTDNFSDFIPDKNIFFTTSGVSESTKETYYLGRVSEVTGAFYIAKKSDMKRIFICYDTSFYDALHKDERELNIQKYIRLKNIITSKIALFLSNNLFEKFNITTLNKVKIDNKRNRWFELNLKKNSTTPSAPQLVKYMNVKAVLKKYFNFIKIKKIHLKGQNILTNIRSTISFRSADDGERQTVLKLYKGLNNKFGHFLKIDDLPFILELEQDSSKLFFLNTQNFWNKKINYPTVFTDMSEIKFKLALAKSKKYSFQIKNVEKFLVTSLNSKINFISKVHMNFLFNLILNLTEFSQAEYIEEVSSIKKIKNSKFNYDVRIDVFSKVLKIKIAEQFIIVFDTKDKIKYYFKYNTQQIRKGFFNKLFTVKEN